MTSNRPTVTDDDGRTFATFPVAVLAFVINQSEEFLLLKRAGGTTWEIPSGALEFGESPLQGITRELTEELGPAMRFRVLGPVHATRVQLDERIDNLISLGFAVAGLGGAVRPGDDMAGAHYQWVGCKEVAGRRDIAVPSDRTLFSDALQIYRLNCD